MTCPHCGARNTVDAPWCTQCLQPLRQDPPPPAAPPDGPAAPAVGAPTTGGTAAAGGPTRHGAFRSVDGQVQWCCDACEAWNALETSTCTVCGAPLAASVTGTRAADVSGRVSRARRALWVVAAIGGTIALVSVLLLVLALRSGVTA